ncbi:MAG: DedA family protein [Chthonomonas sp.]|nr:DedA family protein [Chthonomonas sp.]
MLEAVIGPLKSWAESVVHSLGYSGIFLLMLLDSTNIPIPSEVIMPTGGSLAKQGKLIFWIVGFAGSFGTVIGSCLNYWIGHKLGVEGLEKYGKYLFIRKKEVQHGEEWFSRYGQHVTLWGRFIPLVRTFISLPAGIYGMNFTRFLIYAILGATPWCYAWAYVGLKFEEHYHEIEKYWKYVDIVVVVAILLFLTKWFISRRKERLADIP